MYGTVARMRAKPGSGAQLESLIAEYDQLEIPGFVATYVASGAIVPLQCARLAR